jgi:predicted nucleotidyltransferase
VSRNAPIHAPEEGDYIETYEGLFFAVKGNRHPDDRIIAYLRYIPDQKGDRVRDGIRYKRLYDIDETTKIIQESYPQYFGYIDWLGFSLQVVPKSLIKRYYEPRKKLETLQKDPVSSLEKSIIWFVETLSRESNVYIDDFGVSGSVLIGLHTDESDIDLNVYGRTQGLQVYNALKKLKKESARISSYSRTTVQQVVNNRWGVIRKDVEVLSEIETRKNLHGLVDNRDYFVRLLLENPSETITSTPITDVILTATIGEDKEKIFTPCRYALNTVHKISPSVEVTPRELVSYRGKFTEQVSKGDIVEAKGILEKVLDKDGNYYRVVLGAREDYLIPIGS